MEYGVVVRWWVLFQALLLVGLPFTAQLLPDAPDRGAALAVPAALVLITLPLFWVGQVAFGPAVVWGVALAVAAVAAWLARGGVDLNGREYAEVVTVFTAAFLFLVAVRAASDGVHPYGGEKFLDMGVLQSLLRAERLPPQDMWFAGERVVYYYGGHLMASVMATLTGTEGRFAYGPALAGFYAMAVTGAYGLAGTVAALATDGDPVERSTALAAGGVVLAVALLAFGVPWWMLVAPSALAVAAATRSRRVRAGVLAAFVFGFASNFLTPVRLLAGSVSFFRDVAAGTDMLEDWDHVVTPETFDMWYASRVVGSGLNEFPLFAYLNGDLHAHMMSVAVLFTVVGVGLAYYRTPAERRWRRRGLLFGALPLPVAAVIAVNTWSFPTVLGVSALAVALADAPPRTLLPERASDWLDHEHGAIAEVQRVVLAVGVTVVVAALGVVLAWPFVWNVLLVGASDRSIEFWPETTTLASFAVIHGLFLAAFAAYLAARVARGWRDWLAVALAVVGAVAFAASFDLAVAGVRVDFVALALAGPLLAGAWLLRRRSRVGFEGVLVVAGAGLVVLVEFVYLADNAGPGRFNTVFKVYAQVWALWSVAAGVALAALAARTPDTSWLRSGAGTAFVALLLVSTSIYGGLALTNHFGSADDATLDAFEFAHDNHPDEAAAIEWLNDKPGQPHIASAPGVAAYAWQNPASSFTGIPTVAGWVHEVGYRGEDAYWTRVRDVEIIYRTEDAESRAVLLRKHRVDYVWVGPIERDRWDVAEMTDEPGIRPVYENEGVTVLAVNQTELVETANSANAGA